MTRVSVLSVVLAMSVGGAAARAESLEQIKKAIHAKVSTYKSIQYKMTITSEMSSPEFSFKTTGTVSAQYVRKGDKFLSRVESVTRSVQKIASSERTTEMKSTDVNDGKAHYSYSRVDGQDRAEKRPIDPKVDANPFDAIAGFRQQDMTYIVTALPDETVDGKPMFVLEMTLRDAPQVSPAGKTKVYYDKATGISYKTVGYDENGKVTTTSVITELKIDAAIPDDVFTLKLPSGVAIKDQSK